MPAIDRFQTAVLAALRQDGWQTLKSLSLPFGQHRLEIDLSGEKLIALEKEEIKIAVEVKSFITQSVVYSYSKRQD